MSKNNILIVDDDENIAELISLYLNKECYETEIAASGTEALQLFEEYSPDLVLWMSCFREWTAIRCAQR